jgi:hypothetical protein
MSALTRTLSALGGRTARRTAILATAPLLAASGLAAAPSQAAGWVGLEAFGAAEGMPDTAAVCGLNCANPDNTLMPAAGTLPVDSAAVFTVIGKVTSASATEVHVNAGVGHTDVTLYAAAGTRFRNVLAGGSVVKAIAARPATQAAAPLAMETIRTLDPRKTKVLFEHDYVSQIPQAPNLGATSWTVGSLSVDMVTAPADIAADVVAGQPVIVQYTDTFVAD